MTLVKQTAGHLAAQRRAAAAIMATWTSVRLIESADMQPFDYAVASHGGDWLGVLELKCRNVPRGQYPTFFASLRKWSMLRLMAHEFKMPAVWAVAYTDGIFWFDVRALDVRKCVVKIDGRTDRGFSTDLEMMIHIPAAEMRPLIGSKWENADGFAG